MEWRRRYPTLSVERLVLDTPRKKIPELTEGVVSVGVDVVMPRSSIHLVCMSSGLWTTSVIKSCMPP